MSLPPAQKDISEHPAKGSVVDPVNKADKDADVDRKIRFYGVIEAFRKGRLPSNAQIDHTLQYVLKHSPIHEQKLSPEGKKLIQDTREIIETARLMVEEKNADELFQNFVWHTKSVETDVLKGGVLNDAVPVGSKTDSDQAVRHLRTLLSLILTNSEARKLLSDFSLIGRDLLSKGAIKAAETIAPSQDALARVDETAPSDQFITEGGRTAGPNETPILEANVPFTDKTVRQHPKEDEARLRNEDGTERPVGEVRQEGASRLQDLQNQGLHAKDDVAAQAGREVNEYREADPEEANAKKTGLFNKMRNVRDGFSDRIPQQHKDTANEKLDRTKQFFKEEYFPAERRDQFIFRGKKVIIECQKHDDYQESIRWLLNYLDEYASHALNTAGNGKEHGKNFTTDPTVKLPVTELRTLLERFANGTSMDIMFDTVNVLIDDARRDEGLRHWFQSVDAYIRKVLLEPGYVLEPDCNNQANRLRESGRVYFDDKYRGHFDNLFGSVGEWFKAMGEDPINKRFGEDWARLTKDLLFDSEGSLKFKPNFWNDIRRVILPELVDKVGYIPIPRIEYTDDALDLVVENLTLSGRNLLPNSVALEAHNFFKFSPYNAIRDDSHHRITLTLEQIQADMRDVAFYYRKKSGIAKLSDSGLADVILGGQGLSATIVLVSSKKDQSSVFKVEDVHVKVDTLKFSIRDSKHDFLYKTLRPLATGLIKKQIQKAIRDALTTGLEYVDGQLVSVRDRMATAQATEGESRSDVLKNLFKNQQKDVASIKTAESKTPSHFKIVSDKRNSILSEGNPSGWVNRTAEKEQLALQGQEWRSEAFNIINT